MDVRFRARRAAHCALPCVGFSCTTGAFRSDDVPSADRVEGPGLRHAAPRRRLLSPSPPVLQWGGTGKEQMSRTVTGRRINVAEKTPPARDEAGHEERSMTGPSRAGGFFGDRCSDAPPLTKCQQQPHSSKWVWGAHELGGAEFQVLQGLQPGITGSFLRDFKAEPGIPQGAGLQRGAPQRYPTDGGVASC